MKYNRIKEVLDDSQQTQKWLSEQLGVSEVSVSNWCQNKKSVGVPNLFRIASILGCKPSSDRSSATEAQCPKYAH